MCLLYQALQQAVDNAEEERDNATDEMKRLIAAHSGCQRVQVAFCFDMVWGILLRFGFKGVLLDWKMFGFRGCQRVQVDFIETEFEFISFDVM